MTTLTLGVSPFPPGSGVGVGRLDPVRPATWTSRDVGGTVSTVHIRKVYSLKRSKKGGV